MGDRRNACRVRVIESRGTLHYECSCILFQVVKLPLLCLNGLFSLWLSTDWSWNPTLTRGEKLWLAFFTRCSVPLGGPARWGVGKTWHWTRQNEPTPLKTYSQKLRRGVFPEQDALGLNTLDVNQREWKRDVERKWSGSDKVGPRPWGRVIYVNKVRDQDEVIWRLISGVDKKRWHSA